MPRIRAIAAASQALCIRLVTASATREEGASLVEYALLVALIAVICVGAITAIGSNAANKLSGVANNLK